MSSLFLKIFFGVKYTNCNLICQSCTVSERIFTDFIGMYEKQVETPLFGGAVLSKLPKMMIQISCVLKI